MVSDITLSKSVRSNLLALQSTDRLLGKTQGRLATGLEVNSAVDDPSSFFTASSLNARAGDLSRVLDSVGNAVQTIKAADEGLTAITKLVEAAQATARSALQSPKSENANVEGETATLESDSAISATGSGLSTAAAADLITNTAISAADTLTFSINGAAAQTVTFAATTLDSLDEVVTAINGNSNLNTSIVASNDNGQLKIDALSASVSVAVAGTAGVPEIFGLAATTYDSTNLITQGAVAATDTLTVQAGTNTATTITFGTGAGQISTLAELNTALSAVVDVTASVDKNGNISISADNFGDDLIIGGSPSISNFGITAGTYTQADDSASRTSLQTEFNSLRSQISELAEDASYNGVNLLDGDSLEVIFNEDGSSKLDVTGVKYSASGLGISLATGNAFQDNVEINETLTELGDVLGTLRTQASVFGSKLSTVEIREDFTKGLTNVLETGAANLTLADTNEEGANLLALQTRQSLSSTALRLASEADQNVLRLF